MDRQIVSTAAALVAYIYRPVEPKPPRKSAPKKRRK